MTCRSATGGGQPAVPHRTAGEGPAGGLRPAGPPRRGAGATEAGL